MNSRDEQVVLDVDFFSKFSTKYRMVSTEWRIEHSIVKYAHKLEDKYTFDFNWLDSKNQLHVLEAVFSNTDTFFKPIGNSAGYSWVLTEDVLQKNFLPYAKYEIKDQQYYCSFKLYEITVANNRFEMQKTTVLSLWFTMDALYGELHKIKKGVYLSGSEVLSIYLLFDQLFQVQNTFINDVSAIESDNKAFTIPLRLISAIATGKTWYQSRIPGLTLFDCKNFPTAVNGNITQNVGLRNSALRELQKFPLFKWYSILDSDGKKNLVDLYNRNIKQVFPTIDESLRYRTRSADSYQDLFDKKVTIKSLTTKIFNQSREEKSVTYDLIVLTYLLIGEIDLLERIKELSGTDAWVKNKVNQVLSGSTFWVKRVTNEPMLLTDNSQKLQ